MSISLGFCLENCVSFPPPVGAVHILWVTSDGNKRLSSNSLCNLETIPNSSLGKKNLDLVLNRKAPPHSRSFDPAGLPNPNPSLKQFCGSRPGIKQGLHPALCRDCAEVDGGSNDKPFLSSCLWSDNCVLGAGIQRKLRLGL